MSSPDAHISRPTVAHTDERGTIMDLVAGETFESATLVTSRKGAVRGNHYHQETLQIIFVLEGRLRLVTQMPGQPSRDEEARAGDLVRTPPIERHAFAALEDSVFLVLTRGPRSGKDYESDTFRLPTPLIAPGDPTR